MPSWTYSITIANDTDRALKLVSSSIPWGEKENEFPDTIDAGQTGTFKVISPAARPYGIEFYFSLRDVAPAGQKSYGLMNFYLDMPYWKHNNTNTIECTGLLKASGFVKVPDGAHDYSTTASITMLASSDSSGSAGNNREIYDWNNVGALPPVKPTETTIGQLIPDSNLAVPSVLKARGEELVIRKEYWDSIIDPIYTDAAGKEQHIERYVAVPVYEARKIKTLPINSGMTCELEIEISNAFTAEKTLSRDINFNGALTFAEKTPLTASLETAFGISSMEKFSSVNAEKITERMTIDMKNEGKTMVIWELVKIIAIFRDMKDDKSRKLVGVKDYHVDFYAKYYEE